MPCRACAPAAASGCWRSWRCGGQAVERGWLAGTLWPDSPEGHALSNLRASLTDLRRALGAAAGCVCAPSPRSLALTCPPSTWTSSPSTGR